MHVMVQRRYALSNTRLRSVHIHWESGQRQSFMKQSTSFGTCSRVLILDLAHVKWKDVNNFFNPKILVTLCPLDIMSTWTRLPVYIQYTSTRMCGHIVCTLRCSNCYNSGWIVCCKSLWFNSFWFDNNYIGFRYLDYDSLRLLWKLAAASHKNIDDTNRTPMGSNNVDMLWGNRSCWSIREDMALWRRV